MPDVNLDWVDGFTLFLGVFIGAYLKKLGAWFKAKMKAADDPGQ